jgi:MFS family permease
LIAHGVPPTLPETAIPLRGWRATFASLSGNREFQLLFGGNVGFFFGMNMMMVLSGWLVIDRWDNASYLGFVMAAAAFPILLMAPLGGVIADRIDRRRLLLVTQCVLVMTSCLVTTLILTDALQFWHLLCITPVSGTAFAFNIPGRQALLATLVPRERLMNAISLTTAAMNASRVVAPPLAGVLIAPIGIGGAYTIVSGCYAAAAVATFMLPAARPRRLRHFTFLEDFAGGFRHIRASPLLAGLLAFATVPMIFAMPYQTLLPVFADDVWHVGSAGFGAMQAAGGIGGFAGAFLVAHLDAYPRKGMLMAGAALGFGTFLVLFAFAPWFGLALAVMATLGFLSMVFMTVNTTAIQMVIPDEVRGRIMSVMMMAFGLTPLGAVPAGIAAEHLGAPPVVAVGAALFIITTLILFFAIPSLRTLEPAEHRAGGEPARGPAHAFVPDAERVRMRVPEPHPDPATEPH